MWINGFWQAGFWVSGFWEGDTAPPEPSGALNPLAIAVQGIGFGALLVAAQGFATVDIPSVVIPEPNRYYSVDNGAAQRAHRRQQLEEDEVILAIVQQFVMET
jgi:hypothetical protein